MNLIFLSTQIGAGGHGVIVKYMRNRYFFNLCCMTSEALSGWWEIRNLQLWFPADFEQTPILCASGSRHLQGVQKRWWGAWRPSPSSVMASLTQLWRGMSSLWSQVLALWHLRYLSKTGTMGLGIQWDSVCKGDSRHGPVSKVQLERISWICNVNNLHS